MWRGKPCCDQDRLLALRDWQRLTGFAILFGNDRNSFATTSRPARLSVNTVIQGLAYPSVPGQRGARQCECLYSF